MKETKRKTTTRRQFITLLSGVGLGYAVSTRAEGSENETVDKLLASRYFSEENISDPGGEVEKLDFAPGQLQKAVALDRPFGPKKDSRDLALRMLQLTQLFAKNKVSRESYAHQVSEFLELFGFSLRYDGGGPYVPYCASGVSYAACRAYCDIKEKEDYKVTDLTYDNSRLDLFKKKLRDIRQYYFLPSPAVRFIKADAEERKTWVSRDEKPMPGWLVIYSWNGNSPNHIGIVERSDAKNLYTVEYNTTGTTDGDQRNGGMVAQKTRPRDNSVMGFVKLY